MQIQDSYRLRLALLVSGLVAFSTATYLSYLYPPPTPDWFYYGFIAKYYAEHGHYPEKSWWRKDEPPFIYRSPIVPLCSLVVDPKGGPENDYRFLIALVFGIVGSVLSFLIEPKMGSVAPWALTAAYMLMYAKFLGGKRTICLLTYPVLGTLLAKSLVIGRISRREMAFAACLGTVTGLFYDGWLELLPLILFFLTPGVPFERRKTFLTTLGAFIAGATITITIPDPNISASYGLLSYHCPGLVLHLLGEIAEWSPPCNILYAAIIWFFLVVLPLLFGILSRENHVELKLMSVTYTSVSLVIRRFGITYLIIVSPLWYELENVVIMPVYSMTFIMETYWINFWKKYDNWKLMKPIIMKNVKHDRMWVDNEPPFEAWLYYQVDRVPARVVPYDMDWRGYEKPIKRPIPTL
ncbi:hypothetical protein [Methanopyrus sp.]